MFFRAKANKKNNKDRNKGFSLVELIVVIAIMAVLVAVLAPQFTKYIDRSRQSNDAATVSGIVTAVEVGIVDSQYESETGVTYKVEVKTNGTSISKDGTEISQATGGTKTLADAIVDSCGALNTLKTTASAWDEDKGITVNINVSSEGAVTVEYTGKFAEYIKKTATTPDEQNP